ncbi:MAG: hypothetical protein BGO31_13015 [Bacteroidetes bacterium 43-16]|nr:MAG: hypothetical protein BGO31_13015 [Bacteroidetes bacterium 43-16]
MIVLLLLPVLRSSGQGTVFKEWFNQKKTQKEYLLNQIAALQVYIEYGKKGYQIYDKGLGLIGTFKGGEFNLHNDFFLSLKGVNPRIARYGKVAAIIQLQYNTIRTSTQTIRAVRDSDAPTERKNYISRVFNNILTDSEKLVEELLLLTTSNKLELKDDERLRRIDLLYDKMQEKNTTAQEFRNEVILLENSRSQEAKDIETRRLLNGR